MIGDGYLYLSAQGVAASRRAVELLGRALEVMDTPAYWPLLREARLERRHAEQCFRLARRGS